MSNVSSDADNPKAAVPWNPWLGAFYAIFVFLGSQFVAGLLLSLYPLLRGWSAEQVTTWFDTSLVAKIGSLLLYGLLLLIGLKLFLRAHKAGFKSLGLRRPRLVDPLYSLAAVPVYIILLVVAIAIAQRLVPGLDIDQQQELGFNGTYHGSALWLIGFTLVIMAPFLEELIFRGLLYGSLKKALSVILAALITSALFAAGHLAESSSGPLYIAAIDTFVLSLVLIYLRQKTDSLWPAIGLHMLKNGIAFMSVFVLHIT